MSYRSRESRLLCAPEWVLSMYLRDHVCGIISTLIMIGQFFGSLFLGLSDIIGHRGVNFARNAIALIAELPQVLAPNPQVFMFGRSF
ncbi:hypothetical protein F4819DRAFT_458044 [Hypoxylon fuscum]|nr:hypothetical protein F4819DRAFT_458044 [Hypoxylon fuscum]